MYSSSLYFFLTISKERIIKVAADTLLILAVLFSIKHFLADYPLQTAYQYKNKGDFLHIGGILHALIHGIFTTAIFSMYVPFIMAYFLGYFDMVIHYLIDYCKVRINNKFGLSPTNSDKFWWLLGLDQLLHALTYIGLIYIAIN